MENKLISLIGDKRYMHSLGVVEEAKRLNELFRLDCNEEKLLKAALYHDCGKFLIKNQAYKFINDNNLIFDKELLDNFQLLHGPLGSVVAKNIFNILDEEILEAIKYHTTLKSNPTLLEKIIFIADAIEPGRTYKDVSLLREATYEDIDKGILLSLETTIKNLKNRNLYIGKDTLEARDYFINIVKWGL